MNIEKAIKERRFKEDVIGLALLQGLFAGSIGVQIGNDLPHDVKVYQVYYDTSYRALIVTLVCDRFDPVPEGHVPPRVKGETQVFYAVPVGKINA